MSLTAILVVGVLSTVFTIHPVKATGIIYIRANGSIDPPTAPISTLDNCTYILTGNVTHSITIERDNIVLNGSGFTVFGDYDYNYAIVADGRKNLTIENARIRGGNWLGVFLNTNESMVIDNIIETLYGDYAILVEGCANVLMRNTFRTTKSSGMGGMWLGGSLNTVCNNSILSPILNGGLYVPGSFNNISYNTIFGTEGYAVSFGGRNNTLYRNSINAEYYGVGLGSSNSLVCNVITARRYAAITAEGSNSNYIVGNNITGGNWAGHPSIDFSGSSQNRIFHNNIVGHPPCAESSGFANVWDDGYPSGGNYWSDYSGVDANGDGIGDTPYIIDSNNRDNYPLMHLWNGNTMPLAHLSLQPQNYTARFMRTFTVNATIANVTNLYGYEFKVHWNETLLDLVSVSITPPEAWGSDYIVIKNNVSDSTYWHSLSALAPAPAFNGNTTLVSLTFNVTYASALQSLYNSTVETYVTLDETILADNTAHAIVHDTGNCRAQIYLVMRGDLNGDKTVNILDVVKVAIKYGQSGTPGWTIEDINCDGHITILDIVLVTTNYGKKV